MRLLERPGQVLTRDEQQRDLWPEDTFVGFEQGLNAAVRRLREAPGDTKAAAESWQTVFVRVGGVVALEAEIGRPPRARA